jgi:hypothetical protein
MPPLPWAVVPSATVFGRQRQIVGERSGAAGADRLTGDRRIVECAGDSGGKILLQLLVQAARVGHHNLIGDRDEQGDLLAGHQLDADTDLGGRLDAALSDPVRSGNIHRDGDRGLRRFTDSGTRRASDMTADCSTALSKIGPVIVGGKKRCRSIRQRVGLIAISGYLPLG